MRSEDITGILLLAKQRESAILLIMSRTCSGSLALTLAHCLLSLALTLPSTCPCLKTIQVCRHRRSLISCLFCDPGEGFSSLARAAHPTGHQLSRQDLVDVVHAWAGHSAVARLWPFCGGTMGLRWHDYSAGGAKKIGSLLAGCGFRKVLRGWLATWLELSTWAVCD